MSIKRVDIYKDIFGQDEMSNLNSSISIPSYINTFSIAAELMRNWFLNGFPPGTIKSFHMVGKNPIIDYSKFDLKKSLQKEKPAAAMQLEPDLDWDRDKIDSYPWGLETYVNTNRLNNSFFKDEKRNLYLSLAIDEFKANVTYRILVPEKALQLDLRNYIKMKFRIGYTQEHWVDMDYHIPKNLITQLAIHAGYEIDEKGNVINNIDFMKYLNSHSVIPIVYKFIRYSTDDRYLLTAYFALFIFIGIFNALNARSPRLNVFANLTKNIPFITIFGLIIIIQIYLIYFGGSLFRTYGLTLKELIFTITIALSVIPFDILRKLKVKDRFKTH